MLKNDFSLVLHIKGIAVETFSQIRSVSISSSYQHIACMVYWEQFSFLRRIEFPMINLKWHLIHETEFARSLRTSLDVIKFKFTDEK